MSKEEKLQRVVRRVLSDLDVQVESCVDGESAVQKLTRCRYEAVIVDFKEYAVADQILRGVQLSPVNKRAVIVALVDPEMAPEAPLHKVRTLSCIKPLRWSEPSRAFAPYAL